jgi:hypothetical protein
MLLKRGRGVPPWIAARTDRATAGLDAGRIVPGWTQSQRYRNANTRIVSRYSSLLTLHFPAMSRYSEDAD